MPESAALLAPSSAGGVGVRGGRGMGGREAMATRPVASRFRGRQEMYELQSSLSDQIFPSMAEIEAVRTLLISRMRPMRIRSS